MSWLRRRHHDPPSQVDADLEERLLSGELGAGGPTELSEVVATLAAARRPSSPDELRGEAELVAAMAAIARQRTPTPATPATRRRSWSLRKKSAVIVVAAFATFGTAGVAAAARGSLPGPTQDFVSHAASHFNITFPTVAHPSDTPGKRPVTSTTTRSPSTGTSSSTAASTTTTTKPGTGTTTTGASTTSGPSTSLQLHPAPSLLPTVTQPPTTKPGVTPPPTTQPATTNTTPKKAANAIKAPISTATTPATDGAAIKGKGDDHKNANADKEKKPKKDKKS